MSRGRQASPFGRYVRVYMTRFIEIVGVITFFRTIFPAKTSQGENDTSHSPLSRKRSLLAPLDVGTVRPADEIDKRLGQSAC